jgi:hypothetical protein
MRIVGRSSESRTRPRQRSVTGLRSADTRDQDVPPQPYEGGGLMFRIWNYRHQVTHREHNPFHLRVGLNDAFSLGGPEPLPGHVQSFAERGDPLTDRSAHFLLNPRSDPDEPNGHVSQISAEWDLRAMFELVEERLNTALALV